MAIRYRFNANESRFTVQAFAGGVLSAFAHNPIIAIRDFTGEVKFNPDTPETASLCVTIKADSLEVADNVSEKDRQDIEDKMRNEVLEVSTYPDIVFKSTDVSITRIAENWYRVDIKGDLSLHGVTKSEAIDAQVRVFGDTLRANGGFTLRQSDYRIRQVTAVGGAIKLKDELKFSFDIVAQRDGQQ
jgi:polyisoprenoid-binding protein YceI